MIGKLIDAFFSKNFWIYSSFGWMVAGTCALAAEWSINSALFAWAWCSLLMGVFIMRDERNGR